MMDNPSALCRSFANASNSISFKFGRYQGFALFRCSNGIEFEDCRGLARILSNGSLFIRTFPLLSPIADAFELLADLSS
ncbi:hypothetical protein BDZ89DRAFT_1067843 [Hymenopellis radicata]|nr:hypothetical protein BDZ89DRAFT_1067843 [Hymenopellis radicata]